MDKHTQRCIDLMKRFADSYEQQEKESMLKYEQAGPGSQYFEDMLRHRAVAHAYRNCIEMLTNPEYFEIPLF